MGKLKSLPRDTVALAIHKAHGIISQAAQSLGVSREKLSKRIHGDPELLAELEEAKAEIRDLLVAKLYSYIFRSREDGGCDTKLLMFALERLHPEFRPPQTQPLVQIANVNSAPSEETIRRAKAILADYEDVTQP